MQLYNIAEEIGIRALIGMTLMDRNCPSALQQDSNKALEDSILLYRNGTEKY
jgi:cytosine/adenosine deaminase-related metal-dependent hydrolase